MISSILTQQVIIFGFLAFILLFLIYLTKNQRSYNSPALLPVKTSPRFLCVKLVLIFLFLLTIALLGYCIYIVFPAWCLPESVILTLQYGRARFIRFLKSTTVSSFFSFPQGAATTQDKLNIKRRLAFYVNNLKKLSYKHEFKIVISYAIWGRKRKKGLQAQNLTNNPPLLFLCFFPQ